MDRREPLLFVFEEIFDETPVGTRLPSAVADIFLHLGRKEDANDVDLANEK